MVLDRRWISEHLPHQGGMCLLDEVLEWNSTHIRCRTASHRAGNNPLRSHGRLSAVCGIEYAAQAMAIHGALLAPANAVPQRGFLVSVRDVSMHVPTLEGATGDLMITTAYVHAGAAMAQYSFSVSDDRQLLVEGRAIVIPDAAAFYRT